MAIIDPVTKMLRGKIGHLVYRVIKGRQVISPAPGPRRRAPTEAQHQKADRFKQATEYGKRVNRTPQLKALYSAKLKEGKNAYNMAVADAMVSPVINDINIHDYTGKARQKIIVYASDNVLVDRVEIGIYSIHDQLVEKGVAVWKKDGRWLYTTTVNVKNIKGGVVRVTAVDLPGNEAVREVSM